eukprot:TRINITY_DN32332_c0_g1_i1.p1 TRINITY_DN32332_c0_g1~~TRINITY_DN32332_c0_g1_i1.p1  ORF type:complete len:371 (+),score=73.27 TRINITY_DN32332_c0_g1_i1:32-1114(+)
MECSLAGPWGSALSVGTDRAPKRRVSVYSVAKALEKLQHIHDDRRGCGAALEGVRIIDTLSEQQSSSCVDFISRFRSMRHANTRRRMAARLRRSIRRTQTDADETPASPPQIDPSPPPPPRQASVDPEQCVASFYQSSMTFHESEDVNRPPSALMQQPTARASVDLHRPPSVLRAPGQRSSRGGVPVRFDLPDGICDGPVEEADESQAEDFVEFPVPSAHSFLLTTPPHSDAPTPMTVEPSWRDAVLSRPGDREYGEQKRDWEEVLGKELVGPFMVRRPAPRTPTPTVPAHSGARRTPRMRCLTPCPPSSAPLCLSADLLGTVPWRPQSRSGLPVRTPGGDPSEGCSAGRRSATPRLRSR